MTHSRAKAFARLGFVIQLLTNKIVQFVLDFVCIVVKIDCEGRLAEVRLLLHFDFEETRLYTLLSFTTRLVFAPIIIMTYELVN